MSILQFNVSWPGVEGVKPRLVRILSTDNYATITTAGYLNSAITQGLTIEPTDVIWLSYNYNGSTANFAEFTPSISNGVVTLTASGEGTILPVVSGNLPVFSGTTGAIADSGILATNVVRKNSTNTMAAGSSIVLAKVNGTEAANAVTASGVAGVITTSALTTVAGASYAITWTNTFISTSSVVLLSVMGGTNTTQDIRLKVTAGAGTSTLTIYNVDPAAALNGTLLIGYTVL